MKNMGAIGTTGSMTTMSESVARTGRARVGVDQGTETVIGDQRSGGPDEGPRVAAQLFGQKCGSNARRGRTGFPGSGAPAPATVARSYRRERRTTIGDAPALTHWRDHASNARGARAMSGRPGIPSSRLVIEAVNAVGPYTVSVWL